jgi:hypothetical protein
MNRRVTRGQARGTLAGGQAADVDTAGWPGGAHNHTCMSHLVTHCTRRAHCRSSWATAGMALPEACQSLHMPRCRTDTLQWPQQIPYRCLGHDVVAAAWRGNEHIRRLVPDGAEVLLDVHAAIHHLHMIRRNLNWVHLAAFCMHARTHAYLGILGVITIAGADLGCPVPGARQLPVKLAS